LQPKHTQEKRKEVTKDIIEIESEYLKRIVRLDVYRTDESPSQPHTMLLVNDGQDLATMEFETMLDTSRKSKDANPLMVVAIYCGDERTQEYGMSVAPDFKGWGSKAADYEKFIMRELLPFLRKKYKEVVFGQTAYAGFSLGALSAFDIAWNNPDVFSRIGAFSGSFWYRSVDKDDKSYDPWQHRMMHLQVANSEIRPGMKFFFECGELDETEDRNKNGVIDSIDDTIDLMQLLLQKGYRENTDFFYLQMPDGKHDVPSWAKALPKFFAWL
jgi:enterochelin esterase-like enzyme